MTSSSSAVAWADTGPRSMLALAVRYESYGGVPTLAKASQTKTVSEPIFYFQTRLVMRRTPYGTPPPPTCVLYAVTHSRLQYLPPRPKSCLLLALTCLEYALETNEARTMLHAVSLRPTLLCRCGTSCPKLLPTLGLEPNPSNTQQACREFVNDPSYCIGLKEVVYSGDGGGGCCCGIGMVVVSAREPDLLNRWSQPWAWLPPSPVTTAASHALPHTPYT